MVNAYQALDEVTAGTPVFLTTFPFPTLQLEDKMFLGLIIIIKSYL